MTSAQSDAACGDSETVSPLGTSTQRPPTPPRVRPWSDDEGPGMACDVTTGTCGPGARTTIPPPRTTMPDVEIVYFTDPFCSWCWASEPGLLALRERYRGPLSVR